LAFANAKGNCSMRVFDAQDGGFLGRQYAGGDFREAFSDPYWWRVYEEAKKCTEQHLDRAQLVKHYFGLNKFRNAHPEGTEPTLLYIFWEPLNWQDVEECGRHREEIIRFAEAVSRSQVKFRWMTYNDLWGERDAIPDLAGHARPLKARYEVRM
jgi:hypothetical protein